MHGTVYVIILNYNGADDTLHCVETLREKISPERVDYRILVVDNHSPDGSCERLRRELPGDVELLPSGRNGGYAYGNNVGIRYALEHGADYLCLLNNDTIITEDFITPCVETLEGDSRVAFVGPMIVDERTGEVYSTGARVARPSWKSVSMNNHRPVESIPAGLVECETVYGMALLFKSSLVEKLGYIPEDYFLFFEETEWCFRAQKAGYINCVNTATRVNHLKSESMKDMPEMQRYLMERNRVQFARRCATPGQYAAFLLTYTARLIARSVIDKYPLLESMRWFRDGLTGRFDPRYVKIMERE